MSNKYSKRNYVEVVQKITPEIYKEEDLKLALEEEDLTLKILRGDAELIEKFSTSLNPLVSSIDLSSHWEWETSSLMSRRVLAGFITQNKLTSITQESFNLEILSPLGYDIGDYSTSSSLRSFLKDTLFPKISIGKNIQQNNSIQELTEKSFGATSKETFTYLSKSLGLLYLCIYDREDDITPLSSIALDLLTKNLYESIPIETLDVVSIFKEAIWSASGTIPALYSNFLIPEFTSGTGTWTSGTQGLEKLKTWNSILYSNALADKDDTFVRDFFIDYFDNGVTQTSIKKRGPLYKFNQAFGFLLSDINNQVVSIETLNSIDDCPSEYLPYLADLLGWEFYTSNVDSWRRQLREARSLLQKKGTKQGLINLLEVILPAAHIDFEKNFSEYFESYIPNLIYYILKTASPKFDANCLNSLWSQGDAEIYACGEWDPINVDNSIRIVIDHILLDAVQQYPHLFNIDGYPFQLDSSSFVFNYRDRDFSIPPWEHEKFYKSCDLTEELVEFFTKRLICLGVPITTANSFEDYILDNTIRGYQDPEFYDNSFLFFTKTLNLAPNYNSIMENFEKDKFDYLPLWSGKSSHFNLTVSSGPMDGKFFVQTSFTTEDLFEALKAVKDFIPAKAIKRLHIDLNQSDFNFQYSKMQPRLTMPTVDFANPSGAMASFETSTLNMRDPSLGLLGIKVDPDFAFGSPRSTNNHTNLPVFKRDRLKFGRVSTQDAYVDSSGIFTASGPYEVVQPRSASRRRNFEKNLSKGHYYNRLGFNQPTFLNRTEEGTDGVTTTDFLTLGLIPSSNSFQTIDSVYDLPKVYLTCENKDSTNVINGAKTSLCFNTRGTESISIDSEESHPYRFRDNLEDIHDFIFNHVDKRLFLQAKLTIELNSHILGTSYWKDEILSLKNKLWNAYDFSLENDFHNIKMDNNQMIPLEYDKGINYLYLNDYVKNGRHPLGQSLLNDLDLGGSSLLSHVYGPIFWNGHLTVDGSGINQPNKYKKNTKLGQNYEFDILASGISGIDYYGLGFNMDVVQEYATFSFLSGVEIVSRGGNNKVSLYNLSSDEGIIPKTSPLLGKNLLTLKNRSGTQRIRFPFETLAITPEHTGSFYGEDENFLFPEHNFTVATSSIHLKEGSSLAGFGSVKFWIRTVPEEVKGEKVIWVYTSNNKWEMFPTSYFESGDKKKADWSKMLDTCHTFNHEGKEIKKKKGCISLDVDKESLFHISASDMEINTVKFNTLNRHIKVPMDYYVKYNQVHRKDQKYVIEVLSDNTTNDKQYWAFAGINAVDETMALRSSLKFKFILPDYTLSNTDTDKELQFFKENGDAVPLGSKISINLEGEVHLGKEKLTIAIKDSDGKIKLYCSVDAMVKTYGNGEYFFIRFSGIFSYTNYFLGGFLDILETFTYNLTYFDNDYESLLQNFFTAEKEDLNFSRLPNYVEGDPITLSSYVTYARDGWPDKTTSFPHWWPANPNIVYGGPDNIILEPGVPATDSYPTPGQLEYRPDRLVDYESDNPYVQVRETVTQPIFSFSSISKVNPFNTSSTIISCSGMSISDIKYTGHINSYIKEYVHEFAMSTRSHSWNDLLERYWGHESWIDTDGVQAIPWSSADWEYLDTSAWFRRHARTKDNLQAKSYLETSGGSFWGLDENYTLLSNWDKFATWQLIDQSHYLDRPRWKDNWPIDTTNSTQDTWIVYTLAFNPNSTSIVNCENVMIAASKSLHRPHHQEELNFRAIYNRDTDTVEHYESNIDGGNSYLSTQGIKDQIPEVISDPTMIQSGVFALGDWRLMYLAVNKKHYVDFDLPNGGTWFQTPIGSALSDSKDEFTKMSIGLLKSDGGLSNASLEVAKMTGGYRQFPEGHLLTKSDFFIRNVEGGEVDAFIGGRDLGSLIKKEVNHTERLTPPELLDLFRYFNQLSDTSKGRDLNNSQSYHGYNGGGRSNYRVHPGPYDTGTIWDDGGSQVDGVNLTN